MYLLGIRLQSESCESAAVGQRCNESGTAKDQVTEESFSLSDILTEQGLHDLLEGADEPHDIR